MADVVAVARDGARVELDREPEARASASRQGAGRSSRCSPRGKPVYGVTTGVGASVSDRGATGRAPAHGAEPGALPRLRHRAHARRRGRRRGRGGAAGLARARLLGRAAGSCSSGSAAAARVRRAFPGAARWVRAATSRRCPMSRRCSWRARGLVRRGSSGREALARAGLAPLELEPKESLALMNGTIVMSGARCLGSGARRASRDSRARSRRAELAIGATRATSTRVFGQAAPGRAAARRSAKISAAPGARRAPAGALLDPLRAARDRRAARRARLRRANRSRSRSTASNDNPIVDPDAARCSTAATSTAVTWRSRWTASRPRWRASPTCSIVSCAACSPVPTAACPRTWADGARPPRLQGNADLRQRARRRGAEAHDARAASRAAPRATTRTRSAWGRSPRATAVRIIELSETVAASCCSRPVRRSSCAATSRRVARASCARGARRGAHARGGPPPGPRHRERARALPRGRAAHRHVARLGEAPRAARSAERRDPSGPPAPRDARRARRAVPPSRRARIGDTASSGSTSRPRAWRSCASSRSTAAT